MKSECVVNVTIKIQIEDDIYNRWIIDCDKKYKKSLQYLLLNIYTYHLYLHLLLVFTHITSIYTYHLYLHLLLVFTHITSISINILILWGWKFQYTEGESFIETKIWFPKTIYALGYFLWYFWTVVTLPLLNKTS